MKLQNLQLIDTNPQTVYAYEVKKDDMMDTSVELPNTNVIKGELQMQLDQKVIDKMKLDRQLESLADLDEQKLLSTIHKQAGKKYEEMMEDIQKIQLHQGKPDPAVGLESRIRALENKIGIDYSDALQKLHAIEQAAKFIKQNEKLLANPQLSDLAKAQSLSQIYQKYSPIKDLLPALLDRLSIVKEANLLANVNNQVTVQQAIGEIKTDLQALKASTESLEKSIAHNQQLIMEHMQKMQK